MSREFSTPTISVTIGHQTRLYHAFITTAPVSLDAPATLTLHDGPLSDVAGLAVEAIPLDADGDAYAFTARARRCNRTALAARAVSR